MAMDDLIAILCLGWISYEVAAVSYNLKRLTEGKKLLRWISPASYVASLTYPKGYFSQDITTKTMKVDF